ncbi:MAG: hypothetical protein ACTHOR_19870 [Devosia sp.]|jgi:hypothetical protein
MVRSVLLSAGLIVGSTLGVFAAGMDQPSAPSAEYGKYVSILGGCNDCHTPGYNESGGQIDPAKALIGNTMGYQGPWGTTYPTNLRLLASTMTEDDWVKFLDTFKARPPMPYYNVNAMNETMKRSLHKYLISLGKAGDPAPDYVPPGGKVKFPYVVEAPPTMPQ